MKKAKSQKQTEPVAELFRLSRQLLISPSEENCQTILGWILEGAKSVATCYKQAPRKEKSFHANRAKKFEEEWQKLMPQLQTYSDPTILRFHQLQIEKELESVLELAAAI